MIQSFAELQKNQSQHSILPVRFNEPSGTQGTGFSEMLARELPQPEKNTISPLLDETPRASVQLDRPEDTQRERRDHSYEQAHNAKRPEEHDRSRETAAAEKNTDPDQGKEITEKNDEGSIPENSKSLSSEISAQAAENLEKKQADKQKMDLIEDIETTIAALMGEEKVSPEGLKNLIEKAEKLLEGIDDKKAGSRGRELLAHLKNLLKENTGKEEVSLPKLKEALKKFAGLLEDTVKPGLKRTARKSGVPSGHGETAPTADKTEDTAALFQNKTVNSEQGNDRGREGFNSQNFQTNLKNASMKGAAAKTAASAHKNFQQQFNEIVQRAQVVVRDSRNGAFNMKLYPRQLGSVTVNLGLEQGVLNGRFLVDSGDAKNLLLENLEAVRENLEEAGVEVGSFEVNVRDQQQAHSEPDDLPPAAFKTGTELQEEHSQYDISAAQVHNGAINVVI